MSLLLVQCAAVRLIAPRRTISSPLPGSQAGSPSASRSHRDTPTTAPAAALDVELGDAPAAVDAGNGPPAAASALGGCALSFDDRHAGLAAVDRNQYLLTQKKLLTSGRQRPSR